MTNPANGAFQGGGTLGMAHLGAWQVLAQRFHFDGVAGTSVGSIVAALCTTTNSCGAVFRRRDIPDASTRCVHEDTLMRQSNEQ